MKSPDMTHGSIHHWLSAIPSARARYRKFLDSCSDAAGDFRLTSNAEPTPYALCFGVFGLHLLGEHAVLKLQRERIVGRLRANVRALRRDRNVSPDGKPYRQLLTFTLSALATLQALSEDPLEELVIEQVSVDVEAVLRKSGALTGEPQSGNQAMFVAVFLLHAQQYLGIDTSRRVQAWVDAHLRHINRFGFWGENDGMTHLAFQNGYHQYEIFEYLGIENPLECESVQAVRALADPCGHFAPYPGGGGCYDYDAVFTLTPKGYLPDSDTKVLLEQTAVTLLSEQRPDGGFSESLYVRPRSLANLGRFAAQVKRAIGNGALLRERLRYAVALQRPQHDCIHTHWSRYSRRWDEANLWDSWFRMMTLARIQIALQPERAADWGFIDYPGIGFHPSLRQKGASRA
jgi:hypothetical protein